MASYSLDDAERDLRAGLDKAPAGAVRGDWTVTTRQAGHSSRSGGYHRRDGSVVASDKPQFDVLEEVVARLGTNAATPFNVVSVHWIRATLPWQRGRVTVETAFDAALVPRGPDNPV